MINDNRAHLEGQTIVLASNNLGKVQEINALLEDSNLTVIAQSQFNITAAPETGMTFVENALIKARHASHYTDYPVIADDSGIEVLALKGEPGIYSARYAGIDASDEANLNKLITKIKRLNQTERKARFICLMVLLKHAHDPCPIITQGIWNGYVVATPQGHNGFGYDPIFFVPEYQCTSAELAPAIKNQLSHRGQALRALVQQINDSNDLVNCKKWFQH